MARKTAKSKSRASREAKSVRSRSAKKVGKKKGAARQTPRAARKATARKKGAAVKKKAAASKRQTAGKGKKTPAPKRKKPAPKKAGKAAAGKAKKAAARKGKTSTRKTAAPKAKRRSAKTAPAAKKDSATPQAPKSAAPKTKKRSAAVERLLAMQAGKDKTAPAKGEFLIKAPKKARQANLLAAQRFTRRIAPTSPDQQPARTAGRKRKKVLRKRVVEELRKALDAERQRLLAQLAALDEIASLRSSSEINPEIPGYSTHLAEYASDSQIIETTLAQRALQAERLAEIEEALRRIGQPGYGICELCGGAISLERLKVKPFASMCVPCRERKEKGLL